MKLLFYSLRCTVYRARAFFVTVVSYDCVSSWMGYTIEDQKNKKTSENRDFEPDGADLRFHPAKTKVRQP